MSLFDDIDCVRISNEPQIKSIKDLTLKESPLIIKRVYSILEQDEKKDKIRERLQKKLTKKRFEEDNKRFENGMSII